MILKEIELQTNSIKDTVLFYTTVLELKIISESDTEVSFSAGSTKLIFKEVKNVNPVYHFAFDIPNNKLSEAIQWISTRTELLEITSGITLSDFINWNAKSVYFYDNNGNVLEFITRFDLNTISEKEFGVDTILSISEIGFVSDNASEQTDRFIEKYGLNVFSKQPRQDNFNVLGDQEGLFIFVTKGRPWFPTSLKAKPFPVRVQFIHNKEQKEVVCNI